MIEDGLMTPCQSDPEPWFDARSNVRAQAAELCAACPLIGACAAAADTRGERWGVWGGVDRNDPRGPEGRP